MAPLLFATAAEPSSQAGLPAGRPVAGNDCARRVAATGVDGRGGSRAEAMARSDSINRDRETRHHRAHQWLQPAGVSTRRTVSAMRSAVTWPRHQISRARRTAACLARRTTHTLHVITLPRPTTRTRVLHDRFLINCGYPQAAIDRHWQQWYPPPR